MSYVIKKKVSVEEEYTTVDVDTATDDIEARLNISNTINEVNGATTTIENLSNLEEETIEKLEEAEEKIQSGEVDSVDVVDMECFKQKMELIMGVKLSSPTIALEDARKDPKEQFILCAEGIKDALKSIWEFIKKIFKWIGDKIKQFVNWVKNIFTKNKTLAGKTLDEIEKEIKANKTPPMTKEEITRIFLESKAADELLEEAMLRLKNTPPLYDDPNDSNIIDVEVVPNQEAVNKKLYNGTKPTKELLTFIFALDPKMRDALTAMKKYKYLYMVTLKEICNKAAIEDQKFFNIFTDKITKALDAKENTEITGILTDLDAEIEKHVAKIKSIYTDLTDKFEKETLREDHFIKYGLPTKPEYSGPKEDVIVFPSNIQIEVDDKNDEIILHIFFLQINKSPDAEWLTNGGYANKVYGVSTVTDLKIDKVLKEESEVKDDVEDFIKAFNEIEKLYSDFDKKVSDPLQRQLEKLETSDSDLLSEFTKRLKLVDLDNRVKNNVVSSTRAIKDFTSFTNGVQKYRYNFIKITKNLFDSIVKEKKNN